MMPFKNESFTNITVAFGVRNFYDIREGFKSFHDVLKKEGKATIIEFQLPKQKFFKSLYRFYFNKILIYCNVIIISIKIKNYENSSQRNINLLQPQVKR